MELQELSKSTPLLANVFVYIDIYKLKEQT